MYIQEFLTEYAQKTGMSEKEILENKMDLFSCLYIASGMNAQELREVIAYCKERKKQLTLDA